MNETYVKNRLQEQLLKDQAIKTYRITDLFRSGVPDMLVARAGKCAWLEVKFADDPLMPCKWLAYKRSQSESSIRLRHNTGINVYYFCRNFDGLFSISSIESVVECREKKKSLLNHPSSLQGDIAYAGKAISDILKGEVKLGYARSSIDG